MDFVTQYFEATTEDRVDLIFNNYVNFLEIIAAYMQEIIYHINEEIDAKRTNEYLTGARINTGVVSDPTYRKAVQEISIEDAVMTGRFDGDILDETDNKAAYIRRSYFLRKMKRDYEVVANKINALKPQDKDYLLPILLKEKTIHEVAIECHVEYGTIATRICRLKAYVRKNVCVTCDREVSWLQK